MKMHLDDYRSKIKDKNSRYKDRLFEICTTSDLVDAGSKFLSLDEPDIEIATLIDHELRKRRSLDRTLENEEGCKELRYVFQSAKLEPIEWLYRARVRLRKLHNAVRV